MSDCGSACSDFMGWNLRQTRENQNLGDENEGLGSVGFFLPWTSGVHRGKY